MRRYVAIWALSLLLLTGGLSAFCALVDPYAFFGAPLVAGLDRDKPAAADWPLLTKAYTAPRAHPHTVLLGGSTVDVGFNPRSAAFRDTDAPVFNMGIDGGLPSVELLYLRHLLTQTKPARIIFGISFTDAIITVPARIRDVAGKQYEFAPRLALLEDGTPNPGYARGRLDDLVFATLSLDAVRDSIRTLLDQNDPGATYETAMGWNTGGKFKRWAASEGFNAIFMRKENEKIPQLKLWQVERQQETEPVAALVRFCRQHGIDATIVFLPNHADLLEGFRQAGIDADVDAWKSAIVRGIRQADPSGDTPIWDFSGYTQYTTETVPAAGDRTTQMRWFYEPVHFQPALGDLMLARINGAAEPADLGVRLTQAALPGQFAAYHAAQAAWVATHPKDVARIGTILVNAP